MKLLNEFKEFAVKGNVVDLAVGVIIGAAFNKIVESLVGDVVMPILGRIVGKLDFSNLFIVLGDIPPGTATTLDALKKAGVPVLAWGNFLTVALNFVILAFVIFLMIKQVNRMRRSQADTPAAAAEPPPEDVMLLREIRDSLRRPPAASRDDRSAVFSGEPPASRAIARLQQAGGVGAAGAGDVEGRAVVGAGAHQRQPQRDVHALVHAQILDGDQSLVVVHRHDHVELAAARAHEDRVGSEGAVQVQPRPPPAWQARSRRVPRARTVRPRPRAGWAGHRDPGGGERARGVLSVMRRSPARSWVTASSASRSETWMLTSTVRNSSLASIMRTGICCAATPACIAASACSSSVWPGKGTPAAASASLCSGAVTRAAISPRSAACAAQTTASAAMRPAAALTCPRGGLRSPPDRLQHRDAARRHLGRFGGGRDAGERQRRPPAGRDARAAPHAGDVADHEGAARQFRLRGIGLGDDLRADAGRVAHGDGDGLHAGLSTSTNACASPSCCATWAATAGAP